MPTPLLWDDPGLAWDMPGVFWDGEAVTTENPPTMAIDNRISLTITPAQKTAITDAVTALKTALAGLTINLTPEERHALPKIADRTTAFDEKCEFYMGSRPELIPSFVDTAELAKDRAAIATLWPCLKELRPICEAFDDTVTELYSDVYMDDLSFYQSVKQAAKRNVNGADTIYQDLKERFKKAPATPPTPPTP